LGEFGVPLVLDSLVRKLRCGQEVVASCTGNMILSEECVGVVFFSSDCAKGGSHWEGIWSSTLSSPEGSTSSIFESARSICWDGDKVSSIVGADDLIVMTVRLMDIIGRKSEPWALPVDERILVASKLNVSAKRLMHKQWYGAAMKLYTKALDICRLTDVYRLSSTSTSPDSSKTPGYCLITPLEGDPTSDDSETLSERIGLFTALHLNLSLCYIKHHNYRESVVHADNALSFTPQSFKAIYRKGFALIQLGEYQQALNTIIDGIRWHPYERTLQV